MRWTLALVVLSACASSNVETGQTLLDEGTYAFSVNRPADEIVFDGRLIVSESGSVVLESEWGVNCRPASVRQRTTGIEVRCESITLYLPTSDPTQGTILVKTMVEYERRECSGSDCIRTRPKHVQEALLLHRVD